MLIYEDDNPLCRIVDGSPGAGARSGMPLAAALERCPGATPIAANMKTIPAAMGGCNWPFEEHRSRR